MKRSKEFAERLQTTLYDAGIGDALFFHEALDRGLRTTEVQSWHTEVQRPTIPESSVLWEAIGKRFYFAVLVLGRCVVDLSINHGGSVGVKVAYRTPAEGEAAFAAIRAAVPEAPPAEEQRVLFTFWTATENGPRSMARRLHVPKWDDIRVNYAQATQSALSALFEHFTPARGGRLLLWNGETGTGKSYALRCLAYHWRAWCRVHYVADPEVFFGKEAAYMLSVCLEDAGDEDDEALENPTRPWRLFLFEDTGEILARDARERTGQGLSRLLNIADGLIGQGLRTLILITTNEELGRLHPAVTRPGRCAHRHEFKRLALSESRAWLAARQLDPDLVSAPQSLAELYALAEERTTPPPDERPIGFGIESDGGTDAL